VAAPRVAAAAGARTDLMAQRSPALLALTASALAALAPRAHGQQAPVTAPQVDYRYSNYREADMPGDRTLNGETSERYRIDTHQFRLTAPLGDDASLTGDLAFEAMSGASPRYVQPDGSGRPVQVMSGASIEDKRTDVLASFARRKGATGGSLGLGYSTENDYEAINGSVGIDHELADRATTLSAGLGYSSDTLEPTQSTKVMPHTTHETRTAATAFAGIARVLDPATVVQTTLSYTLHDGYLSDPYKDAYVVSAGGTVADRRPDQRGQLAWLTRLRHFFKDLRGAAHADYRYYHDDWQVDAHTVDLAWHQRIGATVRLVPGVRYYSQSKAFFYEPYYLNPRADGFASSDYRLAPYGALSASLMASVEVSNWTGSLRYEHYDSSGDYALGDVRVENPGLVDFEILSLGMKIAF
jgi:hypothetical protein